MRKNHERADLFVSLLYQYITQWPSVQHFFFLYLLIYFLLLCVTLQYNFVTDADYLDDWELDVGVVVAFLTSFWAF